ncbi:MAG: RNA 2',3'-cyclic phosphodiesterase [Clostridia bacterium]|nr:RNA 2',3'-cyclic phosphodiesterase [Clostridia bacterium]MBP5592911.1 RNA 2',3'-cyclic phosphodiesterase [Clostridia bacterium]
MRTFIAINIPTTIKDTIVNEMSILRKEHPANYSKPENLHLTLCFIGEISEKEVPSIKEALTEINLSSFDWQIEKYSYFKMSSKGILTRKIITGREMYDYQKQLIDTLIRKGFSIERRKFFPHITIAREIDLFKLNFTSLNEGLTFPRIITNKVDLMVSERINGKLFYRSIFSVGANK